MNTSVGNSLIEQEPVNQSAEKPQARAVGSPLPMGNGKRPQPSQPEPDPRQFKPAPPPLQALMNTPAPDAKPAQPTGLQRAVGVLRSALPFVQRILPLLDGNIASTVSNILTPHPQAPPPPAPVNLVPIEKSLAELHAQHRDLRDQFVEQNSSLKRVEDQLEMVREATDRNTLEQQELIEDLKTVGNKVNIVAVVALGLLGVSVVLNLVLFLHLQGLVH